MRQIVCSFVATLSVVACSSNTASLFDGRHAAIDASSGDRDAIHGSGSDASQVASQHLYVTSDTPSGAIAQYALPITATSMPVVQVPVATTRAVAVDRNGDMMVGDNSGNLEYFAAPLSSSSTPAATFKNGTSGSNGQLAFAADGSLYAANTSTGINVFSAPFSNASTAGSTVTPSGITSFSGVVFDSSNDLYLSVPSGQTMSNLVMLAPPYTSTSIATPQVSNATYNPIAIFGEQLFVANTVVGAGTIERASV